MSLKMIRLRSLWFQIHKWLGITLAILVIPISLTGAALVWHDWIDTQLHPDRYPGRTAVLSPSDYARGAVTISIPGESVSALNFSDGAEAVQATLVKPAPDGGRPSRATVWLDPTTAKPIARGGSREGLLGLLHVLHGSLMVPGLGRQIVGIVGIAMLLSSLTGLWLWWPLKGSLVRGLRWQRRPDVNSNLHFTGGFWIALPLAVLSATGVWITFPGVFSPGGRPPSPPTPIAAPRLGPDQALDAAKSASAGMLTSISWPAEGKGQWIVKLTSGGQPVEVAVKDADATAAISPAKPETLARLMRRIHDGTGMPMAWRLIIFAGGLLPALLSVTGILMWLRMRRRRANHRRSAAAFAEAEALAN